MFRWINLILFFLYLLWYLNQSLEQTGNMNLGMQAQFLLFLFKELSNIVLSMEFGDDLTLQIPIVL
jgi:hypothetical protein